jgi:hypothetical protein
MTFPPPPSLSEAEKPTSHSGLSENASNHGAASHDDALNSLSVLLAISFLASGMTERTVLGTIALYSRGHAPPDCQTVPLTTQRNMGN